MNFEVKLPKQENKDEWLSMWSDYGSGYVPKPEFLEKTWQNLMDGQSSQYGLFIWNKNSENFIGFLHYTLHKTTWFDGFDCYIQDAYVLPEYRGKRAFKVAYDTLRDDMIKRGDCRIIHWETKPDNENAQKAYERLAKKTDWVRYEDRLLETSIKIEENEKMNRIENTFTKLKEQNRKAFVTFIMAGDPSIEDSAKVLAGLPQAGADIIELGMPFTDPAADGLTIQKAGQRALAAGASMKTTLAMVTDFRENNDTTPIILMGYANPIFSYGFEKFAGDAKAAGVDGLIIVDLPPEEDGELRALANAQGIDMIRLITPTSTGARLDKVLDGASGFLYYVSITGVTGTAKADLNALKPHIEEIKSKTDLPVAIGFGIKTPEDVKSKAEVGDAVVVGSAIVDKVKNGDASKVHDFVSELSDALRT